MYKRLKINTVGQEGSVNTWIAIVLVVIVFHVIVILSVVGFNMLKGGNETSKNKEVPASKALNPPIETQPLNLPSLEDRSLEQVLNSLVKSQTSVSSDDVDDEKALASVGESGLAVSQNKSPEPVASPENFNIDPSVIESHSKPVKSSGLSESSGNFYIVVEGDSLRKIATKTGVSIDEIRKKNHLDKDVVKLGQKLFIPGKSNDKVLPVITSTQGASKQNVNTSITSPKPLVTSAGAYKPYRVGKGDTLTKIATLFHISPEKLAKINDISDPGKLKAGMEIKVPKE